MGALQVLAIAVSALLVLENGLREAEGASYSFTTRLQSSSSNKAPARAAATQPNAVVASGTRNRADYSVTDYRRYLPVEHTPEVKKAREQFFSLYKKQASLAAEAPDNDLDGTMNGARTNVNDDDYYYYDYEGENSEYEEDDDDEEESEGSEEGDEHEEEDSDEESEYSDEDDEDSSSSSEEDGVDSSEENGLDSSEEGADSSEEGLDGEDSSSSSSSEEDEDGGSRGGFQPLNTNSLAALRPVTDTPEVKKAKRTFFDLYKAQAELSFSAPDDK